VSEGISFVESEGDKTPSWAFLQIQNTVFIYEATEPFACFFQAFAFASEPAMFKFFFVVSLFVAFHKLERTVILTKKGKDRKFTRSAISVTSL
jgi:hypothetical protein